MAFMNFYSALVSSFVLTSFFGITLRATIKATTITIRIIDSTGLNLNQARAITNSDIARPRTNDTKPVAYDTNPPKIGT